MKYTRIILQMLPPVDPATLAANPKFEALYRDLGENKLNSDGTSKFDAKTQREREAFSEVRMSSWATNGF